MCRPILTKFKEIDKIDSRKKKFVDEDCTWRYKKATFK